MYLIKKRVSPRFFFSICTFGSFVMPVLNRRWWHQRCRDECVTCERLVSLHSRTVCSDATITAPASSQALIRTETTVGNLPIFSTVDSREINQSQHRVPCPNTQSLFETVKPSHSTTTRVFHNTGDYSDDDVLLIGFKTTPRQDIEDWCVNAPVLHGRVVPNWVAVTKKSWRQMAVGSVSSVWNLII